MSAYSPAQIFDNRLWDEKQNTVQLKNPAKVVFGLENLRFLMPAHFLFGRSTCPTTQSPRRATPI